MSILRNTRTFAVTAATVAFAFVGCTHRTFNQNRAIDDEPTNAEAAQDKALLLSGINNSSVVILDEEIAKTDVEEEEEDDQTLLEEDSERSPEEIAELVPDATIRVEGNFPLCEGSIYLNDWSSTFERQWMAENAKKYKKRKQLQSALREAKSEGYLKLLYPALGDQNFDYPTVFNDDVLKWLQYFQTRGRAVFVTYLRRGEDLLPQMRAVLEQYGLPKDLVYLAMIESGFNNRATSWARAAGLWQFMPATGRVYGLRKNDYVDERRDPEKSTHAAAQYLTYLYTMFGDWHLASASYNAGEGRVSRSMRGEEQKDFFSLSENRKLPNETRNYVPKIIAAMLIAKNPTKFGFDVESGSRAISVRKISLKRSIAISDLAKEISIDAKVLENLNPELRVGVTPPIDKKNPEYLLRVPESHADRVVASLETLPEPSVYRSVVTRAPRKETVAQFVKRVGLNAKEFQKANPKLTSKNRLRKGQVVIIPVKLGSGQFEKISDDSPKKKKKKRYRKTKTRRR